MLIWNFNFQWGRGRRYYCFLERERERESSTLWKPWLQLLPQLPPLLLSFQFTLSFGLLLSPKSLSFWLSWSGYLCFYSETRYEFPSYTASLQYLGYFSIFFMGFPLNMEVWMCMLYPFSLQCAITIQLFGNHRLESKFSISCCILSSSDADALKNYISSAEIYNLVVNRSFPFIFLDESNLSIIK